MTRFNFETIFELMKFYGMAVEKIVEAQNFTIVLSCVVFKRNNYAI